MGNNSFENFGAFGLVIGVIGIVFGGWQAKKTNDIAKKLDTTIENLEKRTSVDIEDDIVNRAIEKTVDREVKKSVESTVKNLKEKMDREIESDVRKEVNRNLNDIKEEVASTISDQVATIDENALRETVKKQAEKAMVAKLNGTLDDSVEKFNKKLDKVVEDCQEKVDEAEKSYKNNLQTIAKLYDGVIDVITPWKQKLSGGSGLNLRIGD